MKFSLPEVSRRTFLGSLATGIIVAGASSRAQAADAAQAGAELAHAELQRRFFDAQGVMLDFTSLDGSVAIPTPEECRLGKPNALGWWSPIENGAMFNGIYMDAAVLRWQASRHADDAARARRLMEGLLFLNSISHVVGFVGRGVGTDGRSHYPMGSNDQTLPWFWGLWRYLESGLATAEERARIRKHLTTTADAIVNLKWRMPAESPFNIRGGFGSMAFENAPRLLFVCKLMHQVTSDAAWNQRYLNALHERGGKENLSRLEICQRGMVFEHGGRHSWTSAGGVASIRGLWEMETDPMRKQAYAQGLEASAILANESLPLALEFHNDDSSRFEPDWRLMNADWTPQATEHEAQALAIAQLKKFGRLSPRRGVECNLVREPCYAAWIVTLAPEAGTLRARAQGLNRLIAHYAYDRLYYSQFFPVEAAWWRLQQALSQV